MREDLFKDILDQEKLHWWHKSKQKLIRLLVEKYVNKKSPKILDVGCGTGMIIEKLADIAKMWGVDSHVDAIKICKGKGLNRIKKGKSEKLPFRNSFFDCLTVLDVLEHTNDSKSIEEFRRVLKKGGILILTVPGYPWMWSEWDRILGHKKRYTKQTLTRILNKNQFNIVKISYLYSFLLIPAFLIRRFKERLPLKSYSSDFSINFGFINYLLKYIAKIEIWYLERKNIPFGLTLIAVAEKR